MRMPVKSMLLLAVTMTCLALVSTGCQEQKKIETEGEKMARLIAAENIDLRAKIQEMRNELKEMSQQLDQCRETVKAKEAEYMSNLEKAMEIFMDTSKSINEENLQLKAELEEIKKDN